MSSHSTKQPRQAGAQGASRDRLIDAALCLLTRQGYEATVVKDIAHAGAAPMGSFYYHFPGGKEELAAAAMRRGAQHVADLLAQALNSHDRPADALGACALALADRLETTAWQDGCPVATTALETIGRSPLLQQVAAEAFTTWQRLITERLRRSGIPAPEADDLAYTALALIEGAELLSRVQRSRQALDKAADALRTLAEVAITS
jgi:TetR/AcrR family transcriptional repressor of lmrAB and yxaGH operons